jgi:predicted GNAT family N-acyltransferase
VPQKLRELLLGFEAGEPVSQVRTGEWAQLGTDAAKIRTEVFVQEQRIPKDLEWDEADAVALHAVAYNRLGQAVGTGRLLPAEAGVAKIGRMAVNRVLRGCRLGEQLLQALMAAAKARGDREVLLHAQRSAETFYARLGFQPRGEGFEEAGIPHVEMTRALD